MKMEIENGKKRIVNKKNDNKQTKSDNEKKETGKLVMRISLPV